MKCCICGCEIKGYGNNPDGAVWKDLQGNIIEPKFDSECCCCDECNSKYVIPGRIYKMNKARRGEN